MAIANSDQLSLYYAVESTFGTPDAAATLEPFRFTSESLKKDTETVRSAEITTDRQDADVARVNESASGTLGYELSHSSFETAIGMGVFQGAGSNANKGFTLKGAATTITATTISFDAGTQEIRDSANGFVSAGFAVGDWVACSGTASHNDLYQLSTVAAGAMTLVGGQAAVVNESAGASMTVGNAKFVENGVTQRSFSFEKRYGDLSATDEFVQYPGMVFNTMSLNVQPGAIVTGEFGLLGKTEQDGGGSSYGAGDAAVSTTNVINATGNVTAVLEAKAAFTVTGLTVEITNNGEALNEVASLGAIDIASGKFQVSGTLTLFLRDKAFLEKYRGFTETELSIRFRDAAGNNNVLYLPRVILSDGGGTASGQNTRISAEFSFETAKDQTIGKTARWVVE